MYTPYLRGKQYELLALKERAALLGASGLIVPVIEPVKEPDGGLDRCLDSLREAAVEVVVVANPQVGPLSSPGIATSISDYVLKRQEVRWNIGLLIDESTDVRALLAQYRALLPAVADLTLIHRGVSSDPDHLRDESSRLGRKYDLVDDSLRQRHFRQFLADSVGFILHDGFRAEERNAGYLAREESVFTEDNLYFREEGWGGFGDYLTIGSGWTEGGFTPRAVAIHWTYRPGPDTPIMIRHFTSESNGDTANVGGKFLEACAKLVRFLDEHDLRGSAANTMRQHLASQTYPGLGIVKKLSVQNHLELMATVLAGSP